MAYLLYKHIKTNELNDFLLLLLLSRNQNNLCRKFQAQIDSTQQKPKEMSTKIKSAEKLGQTAEDQWSTPAKLKKPEPRLLDVESTDGK